MTQAQLGSSVVPPAAPAPHPDAEATLCVVCLDAPMGHIVLPCMCACDLTPAREGGALEGGEADATVTWNIHLVRTLSRRQHW